ncbi:MAG: methyltetrahydrofolate cobalamin methyltransferase [bacterium]
MLVIGERINSSRKSIEPAISNRDTEFILREAKNQVEGGANFIDINAATLMDREIEAVEWLVRTIQGAMNIPLCIDTPNPDAIEAALKIHRGQAMINSITGERARYEGIVPLVKEYKAKVIALTMTDEGKMPQDGEGRYGAATRLIERLMKDGVPIDDIYVDPLVFPVSTNTQAALMVTDTIRRIMGDFPGVHTVCGLSNVSYGLPNRKLINQIFLVLAMQAGLDAVILDPTDKRIMANLIVAETLLGRDEYCMKYLEAHKSGKLEI